MIDLGQHAAFIWASYGATFLVVVGLLAWVVLDGRRLSEQRRALEAKGVGRRSQARRS